MSTAAPLRIAVVDDHPMTLKGLGDMADDWANGTVVLRACDGVDYEEQVATAGPVHLAIVDLRMPRRNGYETITWIRVHQPQVLILAISFFATPDEVHHALMVGANGVVRKDITQEELHAALGSLRTTGHYANALMMQQLTHIPDPDSPHMLRKRLEEALTRRELEVGRLYVGDDSPSRVQIAQRLGLSEHTVETHRRHLVEKTGARTRVALLKCFLRFGVVEL